jgi:hypothetical protein
MWLNPHSYFTIIPSCQVAPKNKFFHTSKLLPSLLTSPKLPFTILATSAFSLKTKRLSAICGEPFCCGNSWNRTNDTSIFSAVLYQLSYVAKLDFPDHLPAWERKGTINKQPCKISDEKIYSIC